MKPLDPFSKMGAIGIQKKKSPLDCVEIYRIVKSTPTKTIRLARTLGVLLSSKYRPFSVDWCCPEQW